MSLTKRSPLAESLGETILFFLTLVVISILTFVLVKIQPGNPAANYPRAIHVGIDDEGLAQARIYLNLDEPVTRRYTVWLGKTVRGDLGNSYVKRWPVLRVMINTVIPILQLGTVSFILLLIFSNLEGFLATICNKNWVDKLAQGLSFLFVSIPAFRLGYMLILFSSVKLQTLPGSDQGGFINYTLPAICLNLPLVGQAGLSIRNVLLERMAEPHMENVLVRGVDRKCILKNHLLDNMRVPLATVLSSSIMYVIPGNVLAEKVFIWPGLGRIFVGTVQISDLSLAQESLLLFGFMATILNGDIRSLIYFVNSKTRLGGRE